MGMLQRELIGAIRARGNPRAPQTLCAAEGEFGGFYLLSVMWPGLEDTGGVRKACPR